MQQIQRLGSRSSRGALRLEHAKRIEVVAEKRPAPTEDEHAHDVEPDPDVLRVQVLSEVGSCQLFERRAVYILLGESSLPFCVIWQ